MTTIYAVYDNNGCVGRCDAKCHEAKNDKCECICGGAFHGAGQKVAVDDRNTLTDDEILEASANKEHEGPLRIKRYAEQKMLFEVEA